MNSGFGIDWSLRIRFSSSCFDIGGISLLEVNRNSFMGAYCDEAAATVTIVYWRPVSCTFSEEQDTSRQRECVERFRELIGLVCCRVMMVGLWGLSLLEFKEGLHKL
jgi:hypothetical protein